MKLNKMMTHLFTAAAACFLLAACAPSSLVAAADPATPPPAVLTIVAATFQALTPSPVPSATPQPTLAPTEVIPPTVTPTRTPDTRLTAKYWPEYPVVPKVGEGAKAIYKLGQSLGNNPKTFSVVGDCQSNPNVFMGIFDTDRYRLPDENLNLQTTITQFAGSFGHKSISVKDGFSVSSALSSNPLWADPTVCLPNEISIACEYRLTKPSFVFINLGTNWKSDDMVAYEQYLRQVVDFWVKNGVVPILSTKVDNLEGNHRINLVTAQVAYDYDIPVWNFWKAADSLPNHGLDPLHDPTQPLTYLTSDAWYRRDITALQALTSVWNGASGIQPQTAAQPTVVSAQPTLAGGQPELAQPTQAVPELIPTIVLTP